jgi:hypothetical protein
LIVDRRAAILAGLGRDSLATSTLLAAATLGYLALVQSNEPSLALGAGSRGGGRP